MVRYKKEKRDQIKPVKLTQNEVAVFEEIAKKDDLSFSAVFRAYALMGIRAQEPLENLARKLKTAGKEEIIEDVKKLLEVFEIEY